MPKTPKIEVVPIEKLQQDDKNANKGTERGSGMLEYSLRNYGLGRSGLADKNGKMIAGNKTHEKAAEIGIEEAILVHTNGTQMVVVVRDDLDLDNDPAARELALFDNRVGQVNLEWDSEQILAHKEAGLPLDSLWSEQELARILTPANPPRPPDDFDNLDEDTVTTEYCCPKCGYEWSGKPKPGPAEAEA